MDVEAHVKASNVEQGDNKKANLENIDVYRQQYHHLLAWSTSVTTYEQSVFNGEYSAGTPVRPTRNMDFRLDTDAPRQLISPSSSRQFQHLHYV